METQNTVVSERHENMNMLSDLLEKVQEYDGMVANARKKKEEIEDVTRKLAIPKKKLPLLTIIINIIIIGIGWIILAVRQHHINKEYKERQAVLFAELTVLKQKYDKLCEENKKYKTEILDPSIAQYVPERFPRRYAYDAAAIQYMLEAMIDLRADTIKEVVNIYVQDTKLYYMMNQLDDISSYTKATAQSTARAARAQEETAANTAAIALNTSITAANTGVTAANTNSLRHSMADIAAAERDQAAAESRVASAAEQMANQ